MDRVNVPAEYEVHSFTRSWKNSDCSFALQLRTPNGAQSWGKGGRRGSGMVPFERALVSSYRASIITFPLSLRVSEMLPLLCSSTPLFPTHLYSPPNCPTFPWEYVELDGFWARKSEDVGLIVRAISFQGFQPMCSWSWWSTNITDGQTDGPTDGRHAIAIPRICTIVHRAVKIGLLLISNRRCRCAFDYYINHSTLNDLERPFCTAYFSSLHHAQLGL